jgi:hypothetical protein
MSIRLATQKATQLYQPRTIKADMPIAHAVASVYAFSDKSSAQQSGRFIVLRYGSDDNRVSIIILQLGC